MLSVQGTPYSAMLPSSIGHTAHTCHADTAVVHNSVPTMNYVSQKKLCQGSFFQLFSFSHNTIESAETSQLLIQPNRVTGLKAERS